MGVLFVVDVFEDIVDIVVHYSHSVKPFFCSRCGEFVVVVNVYGAWIEAIETSARGECVGCSSYGIIVKFCER